MNWDSLTGLPFLLQPGKTSNFGTIVPNINSW